MVAATKGSQKHVQIYVNARSQVLNDRLLSASASLAAECAGPIQWVSPLAQDDYREFRDAEYLEALELNQYKKKLSDFWPRKGPSWDALARVPTMTGPGAILVEAKAHLGETPTPDQCGAISRDSLILINAGLNRARANLGVHEDTPSWQAFHYQVCNRLAHLYFMNIELKVTTWLVWLFFNNDPDWHDCASEEKWRDYMEAIYSEIGLPDEHPLKERIIMICLPPSGGFTS